jgi:hypothetical protein
MFEDSQNIARSYAEHYGLGHLNSLTKYPSILTLHELGEKGRLLDTFTTPAVGQTPLYGTEKIHGTNTRILVFADGSYLIGDRGAFLHLGGDFLFDPSNGIVKGLLAHWLPFDHTTSLQNDNKARVGYLRATVGSDLQHPPRYPFAPLTVLYGEIYGGRINDHKQYGTDQFGFRLFDVAVYDSAWSLDELLHRTPEDISLWRESTNPEGGLCYGQPFLNREKLLAFAQLRGIELVPEIIATPADFFPGLTHEDVLAFLTTSIPHSLATLHPDAKGQPEGLVLASADREIRVKVRYEDYQRTLRGKTPKGS